MAHPLLSRPPQRTVLDRGAPAGSPGDGDMRRGQSFGAALLVTIAFAGCTGNKPTPYRHVRRAEGAVRGLLLRERVAPGGRHHPLRRRPDRLRHRRRPAERLRPGLLRSGARPPPSPPPPTPASSSSPGPATAPAPSPPAAAASTPSPTAPTSGWSPSSTRPTSSATPASRTPPSTPRSSSSFIKGSRRPPLHQLPRPGLRRRRQRPVLHRLPRRREQAELASRTAAFCHANRDRRAMTQRARTATSATPTPSAPTAPSTRPPAGT